MIDSCLGPCMYPAAEVATGALESAELQCKWRAWASGVRPWTHCVYIKVTLMTVHWIRITQEITDTIR